MHNEWCDLKEVIIGGGDNLFPTGDAPGAKESLWILPGKDALDAAKCLGKSNWHCCKDTKQGDRLVSRICPPVDLEKRPCCTWQGVEDEANHFAKKVEELGIKVHRTDWLDVENLQRNFGEKPVAAAGAMAIFPRDPMQVVGDALIELRLGAANRRAEIFDVLKYIDGPNGIQANPANTVISMPERSYAQQLFGKCKVVEACDQSSPICINNVVPCPVGEEYSKGCTCEVPFWDKSDTANVEGGDILMFGDTWLVGHSDNTQMGSSLLGLRWLNTTLHKMGMRINVIPVRMDKRVLHLDLVMSAPSPDVVVVADLPWRCESVIGGGLDQDCTAFPDGLPSFLTSKEKGGRFNLVHVTGETGLYMGTNSLPITPTHTFMATNNVAPDYVKADMNKAIKEVRALGIKVDTLNMTFHGMLGGALRCSSHPLRRHC